jgi:putative methyltransferase (TIGR04325 family)
VKEPPRHLVLNKVPLAETDDHWTIQNVGRTVVPYRILNRGRFLGELRERGYRLLDEWSVPQYYARIPFHLRYGTSANSGLALSLD